MFFMLGCLTEEGVDYKVGAGDDIIATENGLLQSECALDVGELGPRCHSAQANNLVF